MLHPIFASIIHDHFGLHPLDRLRRDIDRAPDMTPEVTSEIDALNESLEQANRQPELCSRLANGMQRIADAEQRFNEHQ